MELVHPGQTFAENLMFDENTPVYPTHADAVDPSELICIEQRAFMSILAESLSTCFRLMNSMNRRLQRHIEEIDHLTLHDATHRLVFFLLDQLPKDINHSATIYLTTPKYIIASRLSIMPETLSRTLKRLERQGLIAVCGQNVVLLDIPALRARLGGEPGENASAPAWPDLAQQVSTLHLHECIR